MKRGPLRPLPSQERLRQLFDYDSAGFLVRRIRRGPWLAGERIAGTRRNDGYLEVMVDGTTYLFHRIIYQWHNGWCPDEIDHKDRIKTNCRIGNLRPSTRQQNLGNFGPRKKSTTGYRGVSLYRRNGKYQAKMRKDGKCCFLGYFVTPEEAARVYDIAAYAAWGEFAYLNFPRKQ